MSASHPNAPTSGKLTDVSPPVTDGARQAPLSKLYVLGPLGLVANDGRSLTPRGKKAQGLLALLALAPRGQRTRVWLRDKLWSESDEKKSSSSLRQTVFEIKKDLGEFADHILQIDRHSIGLKLNNLWIDLHAVKDDLGVCGELGITPETELLEGCDVVDEEFEQWLSMERQIWADIADQIPEKAVRAGQVANRGEGAGLPAVGDTGELLSPIYSLGFLPNIQHGCDEYTQHVADYVLEGVAKNLKEFQPIQIFDFRDSTQHSSNLTSACETEYFVRVRAMQVQRQITLTLFLYKTSQMSLEWSQTIQMDVDELLSQDFPVLAGFISQNVDRLAKSVFEDRPFQNDPAVAARRAGYTALNLMFKLDETALLNSCDLLETAHQKSPSSIYPALQSYVTSFLTGENLGELKSDAAIQTREIVKSTLEGNPFNSIALACLSHVMGYVFRDHDVAHELIERAIKLNDSQAFVWDHLALHKIYTGDFEAAYEAARKAVYIGAYSPISYSYDTTLSMAATMVGKHGEAIVAGQNALSKQPRFTAAMRYLIANLGHAGRFEEAQEIYSKLLKVDPDFADRQVQQERFRLSNPFAEDLVLKGISEAES